MKTTRYFEEDILGGKRPGIKREWCERVLRNPEYSEVQQTGRIRPWGFVEEIGKYLRVVTLADGETIHNAMPDRNFTRRRRREMRFSYHPETDSLYIHLTEKPGADVVEVSDNMVIDVDEQGVPVGIDIDANASKTVDLSHLEVEGLRLGLTPTEPRRSSRAKAV